MKEDAVLNKKERKNTDWSGQWPRFVPENFPDWLLSRALIYVSCAGIVTALILFIAAKMAGYSLEAYSLATSLVAFVVARQVRIRGF